MKKVGAYIILLLLFSAAGTGQSGKKYVREGNRNFKEKKFEESEVSYRKAINKEDDLFDASFNLGDALYKQEKFDEAAGEFGGLANRVESNKELAKTYHNLGNSLLKSQKIEESIAAYKSSLRYYPDDQETKYNLAYAKDLLKKQQQQKNQEKNQDQKQNKDQDKNKDKQDQDKENQNQQEKDQQEQKKNDQQKDKQKKQQQQSQKISKEDANRLLNALANDEKKIQEKVKKAKAKMQKVKTEKDW
ncbi:MAG: tetratricopeptide repeat protein [Bacteroidetes bacterium]|nr:tetratricopeptide repeat protein [Bacteroidota bacterium]